MKLLICVLNRIEKLEPVLQKLKDNGFSGATVLSSRGMAMTLAGSFGGSLLGSLYAMMEPEHEENKTIFMVLQDDEAVRAVETIESVAGDFEEPNNGIIFTVPVDYIKGLRNGSTAEEVK